MAESGSELNANSNESLQNIVKNDFSDPYINDLNKESNEQIKEIELPNDFEPGLSSEAMLLPSESSYEDDDNISSTEKYERRLSNISRIEGISNEEIVDEEVVDESVTFMTKEEADLHPAAGAGDGGGSPATEDIPIVNLVLQEEEVHSEEWQQHKNHFFILSEAGKPIYSRYGDENKLVTLMGVIQALVSVVQNGNGNPDLLRAFVAGQHRFAFLVRGPLILVAVSATGLAIPQLHSQLLYLYNQLLSVLTLTRLRIIFEQRRNYDLRRQLGNDADKFLSTLVDALREDPAFLLGAVRCLPLEGPTRDLVSQAIAYGCSREKKVVFAILIADKQLVALVRMKQYSLYPADLHLLVNFVTSSESFKSAPESWAPICLPKFDPSGFLYGHISYLDVESNIFLVLLTADRDLFFPLQDCRQKILEKMERHRCLEAIKTSVQSQGFSVEELSSKVPDVPELRHFLYKSRSTAQFTGPRPTAPYIAPSDWERLLVLYHHVHHRMVTLTRPLKTLFFAGQNETIMGWHTTGFELYAVFDPLLTKASATTAMWHIVHWIKKEEDRLFIMKSPTL